MLKVDGLRRFQMSIQAQKARAEGKVTVKYKEFVSKVFADLVVHTPQWSGHLASNWNVLLTNEPMPAVNTWYKKDSTGSGSKFEYRPAAIGDGEAVHAAIDRANAQLEKIRWNTKVTFANPVEYADEVEQNPGALRPANLVMGKDVMVNYITSKYSRGEVLIGKVSL